MNETQLRAAIGAKFPNVLVIADQYRAIYPTLTGINSIRYAIGLLGDNISDVDYNALMQLVTAAETGAPIGTPGYTGPFGGENFGKVALAVGAALVIAAMGR